MPNMTSPVLYRHFDADGELLYVGSSIAFFARTMIHVYGAKWAKMVTRIELEHFDDKRTCELAEQSAILIEGPKFNKRDYARAIKRRGGLDSEERK